jgi:hypothetical protein
MRFGISFDDPMSEKTGNNFTSCLKEARINIPFYLAFLQLGHLLPKVLR